MPDSSTVWRISFRGSVKEKCQWEFIMKRAKVRGWGDGGDQAGGLWLCAVRVLRTPSGSSFGVNTGPCGPSPAPGHTNPGLPTFQLYFPGCRMPEAIWAGRVFFSIFFLYLLIKCVLEELSKCEEPSCRLTFSFHLVLSTPPPPPPPPPLASTSSMLPSIRNEGYLHVSSKHTKTDATHTKHMLSFSFLTLSTSLEMGVSQMGRSLLFGSVNFKEPVWIIIMSFPQNNSPLDESKCIKCESVCIHACLFLSTCEQNNGLFIVACSGGSGIYHNSYANLGGSPCEPSNKHS